MDITAIAAASIDSNMAKVQQDVGIIMLKKAMDANASQATALLEIMKPAQASFGHKIDTYV